MDNSAIEIKNLNVGYNTENSFSLIIKNFNLSIKKGEIFGIAGESGSGKSTLAQAIYRSVKYPGEIDSGEIIFKDKDILKMEANDLRKIRVTLFSFIPQAAMNALNPVRKIRYQFYDLLLAHGILPEKSNDKIFSVLKMVRLNESVLDNFPHELSGGMRQRTVIAMSLLLNPELVILDEPTPGLDVLVEHEILKDLKNIQRKYGITMIFITHDLAILYEISDRIAMIYSGEIVELGPRDDMLEHSTHPYNFLLLKNIPRIGVKMNNPIKLKGNPSNFNENFPGCQFYERCPFSKAVCSEKHPDLKEYSNEHYYRCILFPEWKQGV